MAVAHRKTPEIIAAPSILSADFANIAAGIERIEQSGGDWVHVDVMDGRFVPVITFGDKMVADIRRLTQLPLDVHLMVEHPEAQVDRFARAGASHFTFHLEAVIHAHRIVEQIRDAGMQPGVSVVPSTPAEALSEILPDLFQVLVMTVNPGFGGQKLIPQCLEKVRRLDTMRRERNLGYRIAVDGGINESTAPLAREAGADVLISGSAFFRSPDARAEIEMLKGLQRA